MNYVKVEAVSLVTGLAGTGSDPPPSPQRAALLDEMNRRGVENPNDVLASPNTSLVLVRALFAARHSGRRPVRRRGPRPQPQRNHQPPRRLVAPDAAHGNGRAGRANSQGPRAGHRRRPRAGRSVGRSEEGPALWQRTAASSAAASRSNRARWAWCSAPNTNRFASASRSACRSTAVLHVHVDGRKQGVAKPKTDEFIELTIHPRYKDNVGRYMRVVRNVAIDESASTAAGALAASRTPARRPADRRHRRPAPRGDRQRRSQSKFSKGLKSNDPEVRFYAAEALAYLDDTAAVGRWPTSPATSRPSASMRSRRLSAMDDVVAYDALRELLSANSAETRYGAFRALWAMNENDPFVRGEKLGDQFSYHVLDVAGPPMIHVTQQLPPGGRAVRQGAAVSTCRSCSTPARRSWSTA